MTRSETAPLLTALGAAFHRSIDVQTVELWYGSCFERISFELGNRVVKRLVAVDERWPTPARFNAVRRDLEGGVDSSRQLPSAGPDKDRNAAGLAKAREVLRDHGIVRAQAKGKR